MVLIDCRTQIGASALVHRGLVLFFARDLYRLSVVQARISGVGRDIRLRPRRPEALFEPLTRADCPGTVRKRRQPNLSGALSAASPRPFGRTHKVYRVLWSVVPPRSFVAYLALPAAAVVCEPFVIHLTRRISIAAAFWPKRQVGKSTFDRSWNGKSYPSRYPV